MTLQDPLWSLDHELLVPRLSGLQVNCPLLGEAMELFAKGASGLVEPPEGHVCSQTCWAFCLLLVSLGMPFPSLALALPGRCHLNRTLGL